MELTFAFALMDILRRLVFNIIVIVTSWHLSLIGLVARLVEEARVILIIDNLRHIFLLLIVHDIALVEQHH